MNKDSSVKTAWSPVKRKIHEVYRRDPEVTDSELKNVLENEFTGFRIGVRTHMRARKAAGWICTYRDTLLSNKKRYIKRLELSRKIVEIERATTIRFHKQGMVYKPAPKPENLLNP